MQRAWLDAGLVSVVRRQIGVKKTESMWHFDDPHPSRVLLFNNLIAQCLHSRPMHLRPEMMFRVITVKEPSPVVKLPVSAYAPRDRLVRITSVMPIVSVQIREAVAKVPERQKKTDVTRVENTEDNKVRDERRELKNSPKGFARIFALQFPENGLGIFAKEAEEGVRERMFSFTVVAVFVN